MNPVIYIAFISAILGTVTFWNVYQGKRWFLAATVAFFAVTILNFAVGFEQMGWPKPRYLEWRNIDRVPLITYFWKERVAIYYVIMVDGEPKIIKKPWNQEKAEKLQSMKLKLEDGETQFFDEQSGESDGAEEITSDPLRLPAKKAENPGDARMPDREHGGL